MPHGELVRNGIVSCAFGYSARMWAGSDMRPAVAAGGSGRRLRARWSASRRWIRPPLARTLVSESAVDPAAACAGGKGVNLNLRLKLSPASWARQLGAKRGHFA